MLPFSEAADETAFECHPGFAEFRRKHGDLEVQAAVCVVPDADAEIRVFTLINHGDHQREIELKSYAEACLNHRRADQSHPAFAKLFLETEFDPHCGALFGPTATPRCEGESSLGRSYFDSK